MTEQPEHPDKQLPDAAGYWFSDRGEEGLLVEQGDGLYWIDLHGDYHPPGTWPCRPARWRMAERPEFAEESDEP